MKPFSCSCGARVYFENVRCLACGNELGFVPEVGRICDLIPAKAGEYTIGKENKASFRKCQNYVVEGVCNWMVDSGDSNPLCQACRLNHVIPDLTEPENRRKWSLVEAAKRRLVYTLNELGLPLVPRSEDSHTGLAFDIKSDTAEERVLTGHADGLITLNLAEADPPLREKIRTQMMERYRTLLGHFRHESGHYFWEVLIRPDEQRLASFRALFGDERLDYAEALRNHYANSARDDWANDFVSAYAHAHPFEDWAETWAHYLHMLDTLETAQSFGLSLPGHPTASGNDQPFDRLFSGWVGLALVLNELNRSMGLPDAYPFQVGPGAKAKLAFVWRVLNTAV